LGLRGGPVRFGDTAGSSSIKGYAYLSQAKSIFTVDFAKKISNKSDSLLPDALRTIGAHFLPISAKSDRGMVEVSLGGTLDLSAKWDFCRTGLGNMPASCGKALFLEIRP
jgi:hypothetical protein